MLALPTPSKQPGQHHLTEYKLSVCEFNRWKNVYHKLIMLKRKPALTGIKPEPMRDKETFEAKNETAGREV